jgi:parallel beta-helix repeat protein
MMTIIAFVILTILSSKTTIETNAVESTFNNLSRRNIIRTTDDSIIVTNDSELAAVATSGTGTITDPYIISGLNIVGAPTDGIYISGITKFLRIENCLVYNSTNFGIHIDNVDNVTISNNTCIDNDGHGVYSSSSHYTNVINNILSSNGMDGVFLDADSSYSNIINNTCNDNRYDGIYLVDSGYTLMANNTCLNNGFEGIDIDSSGSSTLIKNICNDSREGIAITSSGGSIINDNTCNNNNYRGIYLVQSGSSIMVSNNTCTGNHDDGIGLTRSDGNSFIWNMLQDNQGYGIDVNYESDSNIIHHNTFINNSGEGSQASDIGVNNQWYDEISLEGNFWSDYSGTGDYSISGSASNSDPYPLQMDETSTSDTGTNGSSSPAFTYLLSLITLITSGLFLKKRRRCQ